MENSTTLEGDPIQAYIVPMNDAHQVRKLSTPQKIKHFPIKQTTENFMTIIFFMIIFAPSSPQLTQSERVHC